MRGHTGEGYIRRGDTHRAGTLTGGIYALRGTTRKEDYTEKGNTRRRERGQRKKRDTHGAGTHAVWTYMGGGAYGGNIWSGILKRDTGRACGLWSVTELNQKIGTKV